MKNLQKIQELASAVQAAETPTQQGRQTVAKACKELYNLIEDGLYNKFGEEAITDAFTDLCRGNFAEPFICERKKNAFTLYKTLYTKYAMS